MAGGSIHTSTLLFLCVLVSNAASPMAVKSNFQVPSSCTRTECPGFDVVHSGKGFEIRRYNSTVWISTAPIDDNSLVTATKTGFRKLFDYVKGKNEHKVKIEMTAPVLTEVKPSDGPINASSFVVSFYVPKVHQAHPPPAEGLHVQHWGKTHVAVRQFTGFVVDTDLAAEVKALLDTVAGTVWGDAIANSHAGGQFSVAQYHSPRTLKDRVNEIWLTFQWNDSGNVRK